MIHEWIGTGEVWPAEGTHDVTLYEVKCANCGAEKWVMEETSKDQEVQFITVGNCLPD